MRAKLKVLPQTQMMKTFLGLPPLLSLSKEKAQVLVVRLIR